MDSSYSIHKVSDVTASSPASKAGVMKGDFVFFINGVEVKSVSKAKSLIETTPSGNFILTVQRFFSSHAASTGPVQVNTADGLLLLLLLLLL